MIFILPIGVGSKSIITTLGTTFPAPVWLKKVAELLSSACASMPSGRIPCSKQYSSQQALPT